MGDSQGIGRSKERRGCTALMFFYPNVPFHRCFGRAVLDQRWGLKEGGTFNVFSSVLTRGIEDKGKAGKAG